MAYIPNIEEETVNNEYFRKVLYTDSHIQLVVMSLNPGEEIGMEVHDNLDQFIRIEAGSGEAIIDGETHSLTDGSVVIIPKGANHNITNTSLENKLKLYTIYTPPQHEVGTIHKTKAEADAAEEHYHG